MVLKGGGTSLGEWASLNFASVGVLTTRRSGSFRSLRALEAALYFTNAALYSPLLLRLSVALLRNSPVCFDPPSSSPCSLSHSSLHALILEAFFVCFRFPKSQPRFPFPLPLRLTLWHFSSHQPPPLRIPPYNKSPTKELNCTSNMYECEYQFEMIWVF